jgi:type VI secretion system protein ImpC
MSQTKSAAAKAVPSAQASEVTLLDQIVEQGRFGREPESRERGRDMVKEFVSQFLEGEMTLSRDAQAMIGARIAQIDHLISIQLNEILHHPDFQKLEASWRGLRYLVEQSETSSMLKIKVLNASKKELLRDMQRAPEFDRSGLFQKIYEDGFGIFGGEPFGALIGDFEISKHPEDIEFLEKISQVAAAAHAPFLTAASPQLLSMDSFTQLGDPRDIGAIFENTTYGKWKTFRESEDSRYIALAMPHILMRLPYGKDTQPVDGFNYEEAVDGSDHSKYLWGNAAYALGARVTNAFTRYGWCAAIRGVESGGLVEGLPAHNFQTDQGDVALKCPTEIAVTDRREKELADHGLAPLVHRKGTDNAAFFSVQSANKPKKYDKPEANANARLSAQIPYIMATCRFAHYLKVIMRDKVGGFMSRLACEKFLNQWIAQYVVLDDNAGLIVKAEHPLREAHVEVSEVAGKPGVYKAIAFLRPHFQLDELTVSLRLVAELPPSIRK